MVCVERQLEESFEAGAYGVDQEAKLGLSAVRINLTPLFLHTDDLAEDLIARDKNLLLAPCVVASHKGVTRDKGQGMRFNHAGGRCFRLGGINANNTMGNYTFILTVKNNVTDADGGWLDGLNRDNFVLLDGGIHASTRRLKANAFAPAQQLFAQVCEKMNGGEGDGRFEVCHGSILP